MRNVKSKIRMVREGILIASCLGFGLYGVNELRKVVFAETIHPFTDGNGRTGRLLTLLQLYLSGWDFKEILVLEDYYNRNRKAYYEALQTGPTYRARQDADLTNWLEYFVAGNIGSTRNVLDKAEIQIVDFVITMGQITSEDVVDILGVPKRTAQDKLKRLEDAKVLKKKGSGPNTVYVVKK